MKYLLLHRELQLEASRYDGSTALQIAKGFEYHRMINLLVNAGADNSRNCSVSDSEDDLMVDGDVSNFISRTRIFVLFSVLRGGIELVTICLVIGRAATA